MTDHPASFTPGPWKVIDAKGGLFVCAKDLSDHQYRDEWEPLLDMAGSTPECQANARLIAAAPDLYAALERLMSRSGVLNVLEDGEREEFQALLANTRGD